MRRHPWWSGGGVLAVAAVVAFVLVYFQPQALFINHTVDEPLPAAAALASASPSATPSGNAVVPQPVATTRPEQTLARGEFRSLEHHTTGVALVIRLADGSAVVRIENLDTSNGPDVHVTLSPTPSTAGDRDYGDYVDLGSLKGNRGNQNYSVPAGTDLSRYRSVVIWCKRFTVGFGVAPIA
ncbi:MAG TPA: DM13 domain-containing protein [Candidatus Dormibacteraeota bacterium]|nr:DM13 domain-containing protein [Candidatus Dormibacteraeota bacterium]